MWEAVELSVGVVNEILFACFLLICGGGGGGGLEDHSHSWLCVHRCSWPER